MNRITGKLRFALAAVFASAALTAWGITITLNDGASSAVCVAGSGATIGANGDITASVSASTACTLGGGGGGGGGTGPWALSLNVSGTGTGSTVTSDVGGINCGIGNTGTCVNNSITNNTAVILTANPVNANFAWGGDCSGSAGANCNLSMTGNKSVSVTFTSTGGGGGDPGAGTNPWVNGSNYVHNRGTLTEIYVPRCVPNQYTNCRAGGQQSLYDSVVAGKVWSMRLPFGQTSSTSNFSYTIARSETGETLTAFDQTISTTPGDFSAGIAANCKRMNAVDPVFKVHDSVAVPNPPSWWGSCPLARNTVYYINVRPAAGSAGETQCGTGGKGCRYKIILPSVPAGFYTN